MLDNPLIYAPCVPAVSKSFLKMSVLAKFVNAQNCCEKGCSANFIPFLSPVNLVDLFFVCDVPD